MFTAASIILYVLSHSVGLPYIPPEPEEWFEALGVASLIAEGAFLVIALSFRRKRS